MDYKEIFRKSNQLVCKHIESYFPGGTTDSRGWYTLKNFDRGENNPGSFGICISGNSAGAVNDFANPEYTGDVTSFYAKVNNLSNMEAAKKIISSEDKITYDQFFAKKGIHYKPVLPIPEDIYFSDFDIYCTNDSRLHDNIDWVYEYRDKQSDLLYISCRLKKPYTDNKGKKRKLLSVGYFECKKEDKEWKEFSWYKHPFAGKSFPFSNQQEIAKQGSREIIIVEGEKAAHFLESVLSKDKWIITCNGSSSNMLHVGSYDLFQKLKINHVFYWPDNDEAGTHTIGFVKERFDKVSVVKIPDGYDEGWDAADAVQDGWDTDKIEKFIYDNLYLDREIDPQYFKAISHDHENFYFMSYRLGLVKTVRQETITLGFLKIMAPRDYWMNRYPLSDKRKDGSYDSDTAIEDVIAMAMQTPYHETGRIRQLGAWEDDGRFVFHFGTGLLIGDEKVDLFEFDTNNIYEKKGYLSFSEDNFGAVDLHKIADIIRRFSISSRQEKYLFIGWIIMSLIGGAFEWRPHIWLTGEAGSGKTSAIDFIKKIMDTAAIVETGSSTEAGIRQRLKVSTLPVLIDELEVMDEKTSKNLKSIKSLIRQASSGTRVSRGTANHSGIDFVIQSMFCVGSISPQIADGADISRFTLINFDKNLQGKPEEWIETEKLMAETLTPDYINGLKYYMASNLEKIMVILKRAFIVFSELGYKARLSQQYSVLVAGAYICTINSLEFTDDEFKKFVSEKFNFRDQTEIGQLTEAEHCLSIIMQKIIEYKPNNSFAEKSTIFELLKMYKKELDNIANPDELLMRNIVKAVKAYGFLIDNRLCNNDILFVYNASYVKEILKFSSYSGDIKEILRRHPKADMTLTPTVYAGGKGAAIRFSYEILDEDLVSASIEDDDVPF